MACATGKPSARNNLRKVNTAWELWVPLQFLHCVKFAHQDQD